MKFAIIGDYRSGKKSFATKIQYNQFDEEYELNRRSTTYYVESNTDLNPDFTIDFYYGFSGFNTFIHNQFNDSLMVVSCFLILIPADGNPESTSNFVSSQIDKIRNHDEYSHIFILIVITKSDLEHKTIDFEEIDEISRNRDCLGCIEVSSKEMGRDDLIDEISRNRDCLGCIEVSSKEMGRDDLIDEISLIWS